MSSTEVAEQVRELISAFSRNYIGVYLGFYSGQQSLGIGHS
jgi:hypothetical protein